MVQALERVVFSVLTAKYEDKKPTKKKKPRRSSAEFHPDKKDEDATVTMGQVCESLDVVKICQVFMALLS